MYRTLMVCAGIVQATAALPATVTDMLGEEAPGWITPVNIVWAVTVVALANAGGEWSTAQDLGLALDIVIGTAGTAVIGLITLAFIRHESLRALAATVAPFLLTIWGAGSLARIGYCAAQGQFKGHDAALAGAVLGSLPSLLSFLDIPTVRNSNAEITVPLKVTGSLLGNGVGGACIALGAASM
ncbi:hypothetical protein ACIRVF_22060 [Kitasatospora sp. NPDC101157]|uniref:hypothetical protein n=1 Tax=Kitasatospora sp. NPDC101157 TaxID=3364098 RepID=UPI00380B3CF4